MNHWTQLSIEYANQRNYLDNLFSVYPTIPEDIREIDKTLWNSVEESFHQNDNVALIENLSRLDLFPIKDSYVAYLKRDKSAVERNPETVNRLSGRLREMGLKNIYLECSEPKETNRQIGPLFRRWLQKGTLGVNLLGSKQFASTDKNAILDAGDKEQMDFAKKYLNYKREKGLDFVGRFNGKYVIGEAKFLTDFGGHQNAQFNDAVTMLNVKNVKAIKIGILDGVLYIRSRNKMHKYIVEHPEKYNIMSTLVLREFLYQI